MLKPKSAHTGQTKKVQGDWHVSHESLGMGDYYGRGVKNPMGKIRDGLGGPTMPKGKIKTPPTNVA